MAQWETRGLINVQLDDVTCGQALLARGQVLSIVTGGGGYSSPAERDDALAAEDRSRGRHHLDNTGRIITT